MQFRLLRNDRRWDFHRIITYLQVSMDDISTMTIFDRRKYLPEFLPRRSLVHFSVASNKIWRHPHFNYEICWVIRGTNCYSPNISPWFAYSETMYSIFLVSITYEFWRKAFEMNFRKHMSFEIHLECYYLVQSYDMWMIQSLHDIHFAIYFLQVARIQLRLVDNFDGDLQQNEYYWALDSREQPSCYNIVL